MLLESKKFSENSCTSSNVQFITEKSGECLAHAELSEFDSEPIAVIDWIEVEKELRGNGIGRLLLKAVVEDLSDKKENSDDCWRPISLEKIR